MHPAINGSASNTRARRNLRLRYASFVLALRRGTQTRPSSIRLTITGGRPLTGGPLALALRTRRIAHPFRDPTDPSTIWGWPKEVKPADKPIPEAGDGFLAC